MSFPPNPSRRRDLRVCRSRRSQDRGWVQCDRVRNCKTGWRRFASDPRDPCGIDPRSAQSGSHADHPGFADRLRCRSGPFRHADGDYRGPRQITPSKAIALITRCNADLFMEIVGLLLIAVAALQILVPALIRTTSEDTRFGKTCDFSLVEFPMSGTNSSQAANRRPYLRPKRSPRAATRAVFKIGPVLLSLAKRWHIPLLRKGFRIFRS